MAHMDEEMNYEYDEGSDVDNWEDEQVFRDREGREEDEFMDPHDHIEFEPMEDFGFFGEMGMMED